MLNLRTKRWEDQRGTIWRLEDLEQNHLENIQKLLKNVINGNREAPEGCYQSVHELKASLNFINAEVDRREEAKFNVALETQQDDTPTQMTIAVPPGAKTMVLTITLGFK
jgi:hypothetical protein